MKKRYNLWLSLPVLFFVTLAINGWLWYTIQEGVSEWGVTSRAIGAIASFIAIPFSTKIERCSWGKISVLSVTSLIAGIFIACFQLSLITICLSTFLISLSGYLMVFRTQIEYANHSEGSIKLRNFTTWYGTMCTIAPWVAGYWAQYFEIKNTWHIIFILSLFISTIVYWSVYKSKKGKKVKVVSSKPKKNNGIYDWIGLLKDPEAKRLAKQSVIFSGTMSTLNVVIPIWATNNGWVSSDAGLIIGITGLSSLLIRLIFNRVKWSEQNAQTFVQYSAWFCAIIFSIWPWVSNWWIAITLAISYGIAYGLSAPLSLNLYAWVAQRRSNPGVIWGMRSFVGASISVTAPLILGYSIGLGILSYTWSGLSLSAIALDYRQIKKNYMRNKIWWDKKERSLKLKTLPPEDCH